MTVDDKFFAPWKPNWFLAGYYKLRCYLTTGKWPIRVWRIPTQKHIQPLTQKKFDRMHKVTLATLKSEQDWGLTVDGLKSAAKLHKGG